MARSWSLAATLSTGVATVLANRALVTAGAVYFFAGLHFVSSYPRIFKWDGSSLTALTNSGSLPATIGGFTAGVHDICLFDNKLFIGYGPSVAGENDRIYRHTGGTSWTDEHHLEDESAGFAYFRSSLPTNQEGKYFHMDADDSYMFIAVANDITPAAGDGRVVVRDIGGSYSVATMPGGGYASPSPHLVGHSKGSQFGEVVGMNIVGAGNHRAIERGLPGFSNLSGADVGDKRLIGYADGKSFWTEQDGSNWELKYSTNWGVTLTGAGNLEQNSGNRSNFTLKDCGDGAVMLSLGTNQAYTWDPDTDTFVTDGTISEGLEIIDFFVLNNNLYLLANSETANSMDVWTAGALTVSQFYQGVDSLAFKSDIPIGNITPGNLAVSRDGVVAIGNANADEPIMVVKGASEDEYATWEDITFNHGNGSPVKRLRWI